MLELVWYFNIALVSLAKSFTLEEKESDQMVVTYVSGAIAFISFILIVTCHTVTEIFLPLWKKIKQRSDQVEANLVNFPPRWTVTKEICLNPHLPSSKHFHMESNHFQF